MLRKILIASPLLLLGYLPNALADNAVDRQTLAKADALMAEINSADSDALPQLMAQFSHLTQTAGLSQPCRQALTTLQNKAALHVPDEDQEDMPAEIQNMLGSHAAKTQDNYDKERAACLNADSAQEHKKETAQTEKLSANAATPKAQSSADIPKDTPKWHITRLRERVQRAYADNDAEGIEALKSLIFVRTRVKEKNPNCDLAETAMLREASGYSEALDASDDAEKNKALVKVQAAAKMVDSALSQCD